MNALAIAKMKVRFFGISDRPAALAILKIQNATALFERHVGLRPVRQRLDGHGHVRRWRENLSALFFVGFLAGLARIDAAFPSGVIVQLETHPVGFADHRVARHSA